jgi:hypothetical protein
VNCASNSLASQTTQTELASSYRRESLRDICVGQVFGDKAINALFRQASSIGAIGAEREDKHFSRNTEIRSLSKDQGEGNETPSLGAQACPQQCYRSGCHTAGLQESLEQKKPRKRGAA